MKDDQCDAKLEDVQLDADASSIKIVVAGTIASGKTTLLSALSVYDGRVGGKSVEVEPYSPFGTNSDDYTKALEFRRHANNCFDGILESRDVDKDPWPGATNPNAVPSKIWLQIVSRESIHRVSFHDFAGETFLGAFDRIRKGQKNIDTERERLLYSEKIKKEVDDQFVNDIKDASIVLIVISCKDIIDFPELWAHDRNAAERLQFAYSLMAARAEELQRTNRNTDREVEVFFVITQCDQYKALLSTGKEAFEEGLRRLIGGMVRPQIERIYTSSVCQTELKKIYSNDGKSQSLKFCPTSASRRDRAQPCSLGVSTLVEHIWNASVRVGQLRIEIERKRREEDEIKKLSLKTELNRLMEYARSAMAEAQKILCIMRRKDKKYFEALLDLGNDYDSVAAALSDCEAKIKNCGDTIHGLEAVLKEVTPNINKTVKDLGKRVEQLRKKYGFAP